MSQPSKIARAKARLRQDALAKRASRQSQEARKAAQEIARHFGSSFLSEEKAICVAAYLAVKGEISPAPLLARLRQEGRRCALPCIEEGEEDMIFRECAAPGVPLKMNRFRIPQPPPDMPAIAPDMILAPLLAFDREGYRLGYGGGFYDRAIARMRRGASERGADGHSPPLAVGLAFAAQEEARIPREEHDAPLDAVLTERGVIVPRGFSE